MLTGAPRADRFSQSPGLIGLNVYGSGPADMVSLGEGQNSKVETFNVTWLLTFDIPPSLPLASTNFIFRIVY